LTARAPAAATAFDRAVTREVGPDEPDQTAAIGTALMISMT
jgi:hypothetical protein